MRTRAAIGAVVAVVLWVSSWVFGFLSHVTGRLESVLVAALTTTPSFATGDEFMIVCGRWSEVGNGEAIGLALFLLAGPPMAAVAVITRCVSSGFQATPRIGAGIHIALIVQHASLVSGALPLLAIFLEADLSIEAAAFIAMFILHAALNIVAIGAWRGVQLQVPHSPLSLRVSR